jgi:glutamate racemase
VSALAAAPGASIAASSSLHVAAAFGSAGVVAHLLALLRKSSAAALAELQSCMPIPVVGVIEPGVRSLVSATRSGHVGVIGTVGTIGSGAYQSAVADTGHDVTLSCAACPGFVEFVERGETDSDQVHVLAERLLAPLRDAEIDTLLLGCTHYPFLARTITDVMGRDVVLVDSADETAFRIRELLAELGLQRDGEGRGGRHIFESSGDIEVFRRLGRSMLGPELDDVRSVAWE